MTKKKFFIFLLVILLAVSQVIAFNLHESVQAASKNKYWLQGVSPMAGGHMRMYYGEGTITLKGSIRKAKTEKNVYSANEKERTARLKVAKNCEVITVEEPESKKTPYKEWIKNRSYEKGDEISFISATILVKNKKIKRIYFSA